VSFMHGARTVLGTPASGERMCNRTSLPATSFNPSRLSGHARVLASDEFEGRGLAGRGEIKTIEYITRQFARLGLQPAGDEGDWTQRVPLRKIELTKASALKVRIGPSSLEFGNNDTAVFTSLSGQSDVVIQDAPLVFVGYGVTAPEVGWDDFKGADLRGKIALFLINDPDSESVSPGRFGGRAMTYYGRWTYKYEEAARRGAVGALIVHEDAAAAYGWATVLSSRGAPQFDLIRSSGFESQTLLRGWLRRDAAAQLFREAKLDFDDLKRRAQRAEFIPQELPGARLSVRMQLRITPVLSHNVVARLRGRERPDENVVYGAHWDHLGLGAPDSTGDRVYHGAVDNATGVAALIEMAAAFAAAPPTARSIYFVAFTGEEQGLFGAEHYSLNPPSPLAHTAAMLNMDIMNVEGPTCDLTIRGAPNSSLHDAVAAIAKAQARVLAPDAHPEAGYFYRADHFPLARLGVPGISIMPGLDLFDGGLARGQKAYEDYIAHRYHRPADRWSPDWDLRGAALDAEVLYRLGRDIAESSQWPQWRQDAEFRRIRDRSVAALRPTVSIETDLGQIVIALDTRRAPATAANFLRYVDGKYYDGGHFHRTVTGANQPGPEVKIEVIQAGIAPSRNAEKFPPISLERTSLTGLEHRAGTVSMARSGADTATSEFFICISDQPDLNFSGRRNPDGQGYAAFGEVIEGMDIVRAIHRSAAEGQRLNPDIRIKSIARTAVASE
jgi:Zn-dependent M28 family amino/carboxypeptidase/cyclophilin family peptidyl-prolyl cis-trans isomerase